MAYVITSKCERCGSCAEVCPSDAIFFVEDDPDWPTYYIYPENCIDCAACEAECEQEAIYFEDDVPDEYADAIQKNIDFFESGPGKDLV
ncbi:MAG: ferredoxin [Chloroflexi bacterium]|nr:MAG: ferredoxin [Chloroflexota bacterium]RLC91530.1 MAG: ferredoxin [Chloroflexota bacterium]HEY68646.1 4Fe-4S dicluster domain-containing protein [Thermoflexia bacterium]